MLVFDANIFAPRARTTQRTGWRGVRMRQRVPRAPQPRRARYSAPMRRRLAYVMMLRHADALHYYRYHFACRRYA